MGKASLWHGNAPGECNNGAGVGRLKIATPFIVLPSLPSAVAEWLPPTAWGAISVFLAMNWMETKASEVRLRDELKASEARLRDELKASEARLRDEIKQLRTDNRALGEKMDRLLEVLVTVKQT